MGYVDNRLVEYRTAASLCSAEWYESFRMTITVAVGFLYTGLFISPSGISELDCATTKTDTAERSISIGRESLQVFFLY